MGCGASSPSGAPVDVEEARGSREVFVSDKHDDEYADPDTWDHHDDTADPDQYDHSDHYGEDNGFGYATGAAPVPAKPWSTSSAATGFKSRIDSAKKPGAGFGSVSSSKRHKYALLIGCNYPGTQAALAGCVNDVHVVREMLLTYFGFTPSDITVMIDTDPRAIQPTGANIKHKLRELVAKCVDGDELFIHFSGHGTQVPVMEPDPEEPDNLDEAICPTDMNLLCDNDLVEIFEPLGMLPDVKFTFQADCCHSGTLLDMDNCEITGAKRGGPPPPAAVTPAGVFDARYGQAHRSLAFQDVFAELSHHSGHQVDVGNAGMTMHDLFGDDAPHRAKKASGAEADVVFDHKAKDIGVLLSGCQSFETSADVRPAGGKPFGAFTNAVATIVRAHKEGPNKSLPLTYRNLVLGVRQMLAQGNFTQSPCLECAPRWADTPYVVHLKK